MANPPQFVEDVRATNAPARHPWTTRLLIAGWILIIAKSSVIWWACGRYAVPFHPMWLVGPTVAFGLLCTGVYFYARR
ncbi:MAG: hypothetical protein QM790_16480 [Nibricoccus sp.]